MNLTPLETSKYKVRAVMAITKLRLDEAEDLKAVYTAVDDLKWDLLVLLDQIGLEFFSKSLSDEPETPEVAEGQVEVEDCTGGR